MTSLQTKQELNEEFRNVKYILTSNMRTRLILAIYESSKNLDTLRRELKKPSATILHGLKELETINLVQKSKKNYRLTSNGYLLATNMVKLIENWYTINNNRDFWNNHDLSGIPDEFLKKMYFLKDVEYVTSTTIDLSNAFNRYINLIENTENLRIILPIYSENHLKHIINLLKEKSIENLELIVSDNILKSIKRKQSYKRVLFSDNVKLIRIKQNLKLFLTCSDEAMSLTLFFKDGYYDDSQILIGNSKKSMQWAEDLFNHYENIGDD